MKECKKGNEKERKLKKKVESEEVKGLRGEGANDRTKKRIEGVNK